jgi:hypothetical protein
LILLIPNIRTRTEGRVSARFQSEYQAFKDGTLKKTMESMMSKLKPEAAYFFRAI